MVYSVIFSRPRRQRCAHTNDHFSRSSRSNELGFVLLVVVVPFDLMMIFVVYSAKVGEETRVEK